MLPEHKLDALLDRHAVVERELSSGLAADAFVRLSREHAELSPVVEAIKTYRAAEAELSDLDGIIGDPATEPDMRRMAEAERPVLTERKTRLEQLIRVAVNRK
jgi:peptide chain release factor 1